MVVLRWVECVTTTCDGLRVECWNILLHGFVSPPIEGVSSLLAGMFF